MQQTLPQDLLGPAFAALPPPDAAKVQLALQPRPAA